MLPVLVVLKKSKYDLYRQNPKLETFLKENTEYVKQIKQNHKIQKETQKEILTKLKQNKISFETAHFYDLKEIKNKSLVIVVGGDGTFLAVSHYIKDNTPILGINADPKNSLGFYCCFNKDNFIKAIKNLNKLKKNTYSRLIITLNGKELKENALNDILIANNSPAATTQIKINDEMPKCSGLLICTARGYNSWMYQTNGIDMPINSSKIQYKFRDHKKSKHRIVNELDAYNFTRTGTIYIDGEHVKYKSSLGDKIKIKIGYPIIILGKLKHKHH